MKAVFKEYFTFSKSERNGVLILLGLLIILLWTPRIMAIFIYKRNPDFSQFKKEISLFQLKQKEIISGPKYSNKENTNFSHIDESVVKNKLNPFYFNPNDLPEAKWKELGLTDKQVRIIKNYESKGGEFYKPEDLKKIYGISESEYQVLAPFIVIPESRTENKFEKPENNYISKDDDVIIDINMADTSEFMKLRGIGAGFANRIVKYRERLGGFVKKEQLKEVWGLDSIKYNSIEKNLIVKPFIVQKINVNDAGINELKKHPYIDFYMAQSIVNYREKHGKYARVEDIKKSALIYEALYNKIAPYLTVK